MNKVKKVKSVYNPDTMYYFLSVMYVFDSPKWIRRSFQTEKEIKEFMQNYADFPGAYKQLEIFDEAILDTMVTVKDGEQDIQITLRTYLFGSLYEEYAKDVKNGECEIEV
jgi:hypothetical protein